MDENDLKARYHYLFAGRNLGHEFPTGWLALLERLYAAIDATLSDAERRKVHITQQKEKYGGLRVYLSCSPGRVDVVTPRRIISGEVPASRANTLHERLAPLVRAAEQESLRTCIVCGAPGELRSAHGWLVTLCEDHIDMVS